ncbi:MAG TPA: hypothetical protein VD968_18730, partial [Pyrinomonadaceae bacterium]|nr:hypothetical protein [Pyrinomonadaceae bacterium]
MRKRSPHVLEKSHTRLAFALLLLVAAEGAVVAQSGDVNFPSPIFSNEVTGRIAPRDVGDPRRTRHFYTFRGVEGDLVVNLESSELLGAVDVFTATTSRPLINITLLGGTQTRVVKSVYLRGEELLVLRVEARAAGDAEGSYKIRFEGAFAPAPAGLAEAPAEPAPTVSNSERRGTRRVTSTGARIPEPPRPAEEAKAEPTPTPAATASGSTAEPAARAPAPRRGGRGTTRTPTRRQPTRRAPPARPAQPEPTTGTAEAATTTEGATPADAKPGGEAAPTESPARPPRRRASSSRSSRRGSTPEAAPQPAPAPTQRLIIVTKDGETVERDMSTVRRVTVENNQVVVVTRDGRTTRTPMSNV